MNSSEKLKLDADEVAILIGSQAVLRLNQIDQKNQSHLYPGFFFEKNRVEVHKTRNTKTTISNNSWET